MDPNLLKNLNLDSSIGENDLKLLNQLLGSIGSKSSKAPKMSAKDRNNLISKLSSNNTLNDTPKKELKNMNENEKKIHREELKNKLKNKQNEKKMLRTSNLVKKNTLQNNSEYSDAINKLNGMINNTNGVDLNSNTNQQIYEQINSASLSDDKLVDTKNTSENNFTPNLSDKTSIKQEILINNIINGTNKKSHSTGLVGEVVGEVDGDGNLDDYLN